MYIESPDLENDRFQKRFRLRFRLPYNSFKELLSMAEQSPLFDRWKDGRCDVVDSESTPLSLLILCGLRYLGRGWTFDDLSENTGISEELVRVFVHRFIDFGSTTLHDKYIVAPQSADAAYEHMEEYRKAGLPGCIGSTDATHVILEKVEYRLRQSHLGFKLAHTARTYNVTVNHKRQILATTKGNPASWNDKTLVLFDDFVVSLKEGRNLEDVRFQLYERGPSRDVITVDYSGPWLIVDNGYLNWPVTVPPMTKTSSRAEIRFSEWLESIRKDVECTFGILKGRFRVLKTGIRLHGQNAGDKIFLTCCALHNMLLEVDGLSEGWEDGTPSEWNGELGRHELHDVLGNVPDAITRLMSPSAVRAFDCATLNPRQQLPTAPIVEIANNDSDNLSEQENEYEQLGASVVKNLSLKYFRAKLVEHFEIAFERNEIVWPGSRNRVARRQTPFM